MICHHVGGALKLRFTFAFMGSSSTWGQEGHDVNIIIIIIDAPIINSSIHLYVTPNLIVDLHLYFFSHSSSIHIIVVMMYCNSMCE
jgi:hypothetical protein